MGNQRYDRALTLEVKWDIHSKGRKQGSYESGEDPPAWLDEIPDYLWAKGEMILGK